MTLFKHLVRVGFPMFGIFWGIMAALLAGSMLSFEVFGHWIADDDDITSAWATIGTQAPLWFVFVIGIMLATTRLPVAIANGHTRRDFSVAAAFYGLFTTVAFGLVTMAGYVVEYWVYRANGIMAELGDRYKAPSLLTLAGILLGYAGFVLAGWIIGICYYRISPWWATLLLPITAVPLAAGITLPYTDAFSGPFAVSGVVIPVAVVAAYLMARNVPVRPKKT